MSTLGKQTQPRPYLELVRSLGIDVSKKTSGTKSSHKQKEVRIQAMLDDGGKILESSRNNTLTSLAGSMRRRGMTEEAIGAAIQEQNLARCKPPLSTEEVNNIARSVARYTPANPDNIQETLTDVGNADRFAAQYADAVRYVPEWKKWLRWNEYYWAPAESGEIVEMAKQVARAIYHEGCDIPDPTVRHAITKHSNRSQQLPRIQAMLTLAQSIPVLMVSAADLNKNANRLCVKNGVVNLKTGKLEPARQDDLITQCAPVEFDRTAKCPTFLAFIKTIMGNNTGLIRYLQNCVGYALTGLTTMQCLFFFHGSGANGKSTLLNVLKELLGSDYARQTPSETLMVQRHGRNATNDLARLQHVRVVIANEIESGAFLAESLIKQLTGGDPISARFLYAEFFEFVPVFKLFIAGNHKPVVRGDDHGIWRRIHLVPFEVTIPKEQQDPNLAEKLRAELPGILNWAIAGCQNWYKNRLTMPKIIKDAVNEYRSEMDIFGQWLDESADLDENFEWRASEAYLCYRAWAEGNGFKPMTSTAFGRKLGERFAKKRGRDGVAYFGLRRKSFA